MCPRLIFSEWTSRNSRKWKLGIRLAITLVFHLLVVSCGPPDARITPYPLGVSNLGLMPVADLGVSIIVEDFEAALQGLAFVEDLGGYIFSVNADHLYGAERMIVELRVPHEHTGLVADALQNNFGQVTGINALAAEVSVRNARLRNELAELETSLGDLSGTRLAEAEARITLLREMIAFQVERATYLFVTVSMVESP